MRKQLLLVLVALVTAVIFAVVSRDGNTATTPPASTAGINLPASKVSIQDGNWRLDSIDVKKDKHGNFEGIAMLTYTGDKLGSVNSYFTVTIFADGDDVGSVDGQPAVAVQPGDSVTVKLASQGDRFVRGPWPFTYSFIADKLVAT